ncbi:helix-turn-helix transcriptional regulator [Streptomyces sp. NPDC001107]
MDLQELAAFLKSRRDRIRPAEVGLPTGPRRRVPGLRRDEVAHLAGASVDYYTELERGRGAQPSPQILTALARALRLTSDERNHLFHLAGHPAPPSHGPLGHVEPGLLGLLDRLTTTPAQVITDLHETLVQNRLALALLGPPPGRGMSASFVYRWFTDPEARRIYPTEDAEKHSRAFVADLRAVSARRSRESDVMGLVAQLLRRSREFGQLWEEREVALRRVDRKRIVHPSLGVIELDCHNLFSEDGRQRLLWFSAPPGSAGAEQLELLSVVGTQDLAV